MKMNFEIRDATKDDMNDVLSLIKELARFEKEPDAVEISVEDLVAHGFSSDPLFICHVAVHENKTVGMSLGYKRYSTWKGPTMHLEDLIVSKKYRKKGIGKALLSNFIKVANSLGAKRIEWAVLNWNTDAISFYEFNGAKVSNEWYITQMNESAIQNFLKKHNGSK